MYFVLGAAVLIAAIAFIHLGRLVIERLEASGSRRQTLALDLFSVSFTALCGLGLIILARELMIDASPVRLLGFLAALAAAVVGSKLVAATFRRVAMRNGRTPDPAGGAPAA